MKKSLIIGVILLIISIGLIIYSELNKTNIHELTNSGMKIENKKVYLDATFVAGSITNDSNNGFYVIFGDGVQYIVYMKNTLANKINRYLLDNEEESYHIEGVTKLIPKDIEENGIKFVKEWLDHSHNHTNVEEHDHNITIDDFYHYFGYVYLDTNDFNYIKIIFYVTSIMSILFIISYINTKYHLL